MLKETLMRIAWPAFLAACVLELLVFALVDPSDLHWSGQQLGWSRQAVYSASFFVFWLVSMASSALTHLLGLSSAQVNEATDPADGPPGAGPQA